MVNLSVKSREKIALAVFAGLIVLSLCGLGWYLLAGHSWNVAASNIDDTFGSMDGYTAIVYAGLDHPEKPSQDPDGMEDDEGAAGAPLADEGAEAGSAGGTGSSGSSGAGNPADEGTASGAGGPAASGFASPGGSSASASSKKGVTVAEAKDSYEEKGATVFSLDTVEPELYDEGTILKKGGHRFGVFSVLEPTSVRALEKQVAYFTDHKVDFIVVLTSDKEYVEGVTGIDIVLSTQDEGLFVMGETMDGTFFVNAPDEGTVGAILISPSNVVSAKVIEEL